MRPRGTTGTDETSPRPQDPIPETKPMTAKMWDAFIIDRTFDQSRRPVTHGRHKHGDQRGPRHFAEQEHHAGQAVHVVYATSVVHGVYHTLYKSKHHHRAGKIRVLRFYGHGAPGAQIVGGNRDLSDKAKVIDLTEQGDVRHGHALALFRKYLDPDESRVELHGCRVARGEAGHDLLVGLANVFQVPVLAAPVGQHSDSAKEAAFAQRWVYAAVPGCLQLIEQNLNGDTLG
jgi:hypothetical protein